MRFLNRDFFARDTLAVARDLIGTTLVCGGCEGLIVEVEAYTTDLASHAVTRRNQAATMRETFGHVYIYLIYGMYYCLNFTTDQAGPGAVLIRAAQPTRGIEKMMERRGTTDPTKLASGPGKLCEAFGIGPELNGTPIGKNLRVKPRRHKHEIGVSKRIGITRDSHLPWRFFEIGSPYVSRGPGRHASQGTTSKTAL